MRRPPRDQVLMDEAINDLKNKTVVGTEEGHIIADKILCEVLRRLGYDEIVDEYEKISKWFTY